MAADEKPSMSYWNLNLPPSQHLPSCPSFLLPTVVNPKDLSILSTPDSEYHLQSWSEVCSIVAENRLAGFQRKPSELRRYLVFVHGLKKRYGSVMRFVLEQRLGWNESEIHVNRDVDDDTDGFVWDERNGYLKILRNDWPYGIDPKIVHLVVWTRFDFEEDGGSLGELTSRARAEIERYVDEKFYKAVGRHNVIWFKNWTTIKSVRAIEHFHVMLYDPDPQFVDEVTHGDIAICDKTS